MARAGLPALIAFKIVCCAALLFIALGGLGLLGGLGTGSLVLAALGLALLAWGVVLYVRRRRGASRTRTGP